MSNHAAPERGDPGERAVAMSGERWVHLERSLDAPPDRVHRAWSDPEELPRWLPRGIEGGLAVGTRSTLVWPDRRVWWEVLEATAGKALVVRHPWLPDDALITTTTIGIEPRGYGSRLVVRDGPFPIGDAGVLEAWVAAIEFWTEAVTMLRAHLDFSVDLRPRW
jgi:uncharacterized protein YndB with AHSA1/START domain